MSASAKLLDRLNSVKQTGKDRWMALCPAHEDRSPSLSVRETSEGRILIWCFGGCGAVDVLAAVGLQLSDLFSEPLAHYLPPIRSSFSARELLELNSHEVTVASLLASDAQTRALTADEVKRLSQAASRLSKARELANGR